MLVLLINVVTEMSCLQCNDTAGPVKSGGQTAVSADQRSASYK